MTGSQVVADARRSISSNDFVHLPKAGNRGSERSISLRRHAHGQHSMDRISGQGIAAKAAAEMAAINGSMTTPPSRMMGSKNFSTIHLKSQTRHKNLETSPSTKQLLQSVSSIAAASGSGQPESMLGSRRIPVSLNKSALVAGAQQRKNISTSTFEQRKSSYHIDNNVNLGDALPNYQQTLLASQA